MGKPKIRDRKLLQLIDKENKSQSEAAQVRGWDPQEDNEADASLLLEYGLFELNGPVIFTPKKRF